MNIFAAIGDIINFIINRPLGFILGICYQMTKNYGFALILFTIITRVLLFPLAVKQQRSTAEMMRLNPKIKEIQKKYAKNSQKLNEETMKLYQEEGYSPFGGCLPMLIQLPILYGLFGVIYHPLNYILGLSADKIAKIETVLKPFLPHITDQGRLELYAAQAMGQHMDKLTGIVPNGTIALKFNFLGLNLSDTPTLAFNLMILIPIICYITSLLSSWASMKINSTMADQQTKSMNTSMLIVMPLVSTYFAFTVPAGVGFYWICTNLFMIIQAFLLNKFYNVKELSEKSEEKSRQRKIDRLKAAGVYKEGQDLAEESGDENTEDQSGVKKISKRAEKELNKKKLSASRAAEEKEDEE